MLADELPQAVGERLGLARRRVRHENREFLAAIAADDVVFPERPGTQSGNGFQYGVAGIVAILVVDQLEVVDIENGDGQTMTIAEGPSVFVLG